VKSVEVALGSLARLCARLATVDQSAGAAESIRCTHRVDHVLVPAERLDAAIDAVRALGKPHVLSFKTETSPRVTST
jgi:hypothetical protein